MKKTLLKVILTIIFLGYAGLLISTYNIDNLIGLSRFSYRDRATVSNATELIQFITDRHKASTVMGYKEILVGIVLPCLFVTFTIVLWGKVKSLFKFFILLFSVFLILFSIAYLTNQVSINRVNKELSRELPVWQSKFKLIEDPIVTKYVIEDAATLFSEGHYGRIAAFSRDGHLVSFIKFGIPDGFFRECRGVYLNPSCQRIN